MFREFFTDDASSKAKERFPDIMHVEVMNFLCIKKDQDWDQISIF